MSTVPPVPVKAPSTFSGLDFGVGVVAGLALALVVWAVAGHVRWVGPSNPATPVVPVVPVDPTPKPWPSAELPARWRTSNI